jgi:hypothetical protein
MQDPTPQSVWPAKAILHESNGPKRKLVALQYSQLETFDDVEDAQQDDLMSNDVAIEATNEVDKIDDLDDTEILLEKLQQVMYKKAKERAAAEGVAARPPNSPGP